MEVNELSQKAMGGTEIMLHSLYNNVNKDLLDKFQIIPSRVRNLDKTKYRVLWLHDLPEDPESEKALSNGGWKQFHKLIFVSNWQMQRYIEKYNIPWSKCTVLKNAIVPIQEATKSSDKIKIIYTSTPHRGLEILQPVFDDLSKKYDNIELDVFSSFKLYGWESRDQQYEKLFDNLRANPKVTYHGAKPNMEVREALAQAHIFAYPSIWPETSCMCLIEAMSAGLLCVHPNFAALPETASNWTLMYDWNENISEHANRFHSNLEFAINVASSSISNYRFKAQKQYTDMFFSWDLRKQEWEELLRNIITMPLELEDEKEVFIYRR